MSVQPPIIDAERPNADQQRLATTFAEIEAKQLDFLDESGKSVIERVATLLAVVFAVVAFGDKFPPPYLKDMRVKYLAVGALVFYLGAMFAAMHAVQPRSYKRFRHNLQGMREELDRIVANKSRSVRLAGILFWIGSVMLALLIGVLVFALA